MASYSINKKQEYESIINSTVLDGYTFHPKKNSSYIQVNEVKIVPDEMIEVILTRKIDKAFKRVIALAMAVIDNEDASSSDVRIVLDEVELVREILLNKYQKFLSQEKESLYLKKLRLIENEMRLKQVQIVNKINYIHEEEKSMGRSR